MRVCHNNYQTFHHFIFLPVIVMRLFHFQIRHHLEIRMKHSLKSFLLFYIISYLIRFMVWSCVTLIIIEP